MTGLASSSAVRWPTRSIGWRGVVLLTAILALSACALVAPPRPASLAITDVTVIDAVSGARPQQTVLIAEGRIVKVQDSRRPLPPVAQRIDGQGRFLIPGLWDFHVHLSYDPRWREAMPAMFLDYGVTSVRDTGGQVEQLQPIVEGLRSGEMAGPHVYFSGPLLDGGQVVYGGGERPSLGVPVATPAQAHRIVNQLHAADVDFIKIYEMVSPEVFEALVAAAQALGLPIDSHVPLSMRARAVANKIDGIQHRRNIELDCTSQAPELLAERLRLLENPAGLAAFELRSSIHGKQSKAAISSYSKTHCQKTIDALANTLQVPTLRLMAYTLSPPYLSAGWAGALSVVPAELQADWRAYSTERLANPPDWDTTAAKWSLFLTGEMVRSGVPFAAGTDTPIAYAVPGYSLHRELELLVRAGMTPIGALAAATIRPASFFSLEQEHGQIRAGFHADLVLLSADPLQAINNTQQIEHVIAKGVVVR